VATIFQLGLVVASMSTPTFVALAPSLVLGGIITTLYGLGMAVLARRSAEKATVAPSMPPSGTRSQSCAATDFGPGKPFDFRSALTLAAIVSVIMLGSSVLLTVLGEAGAMLAAAFGGLADAHSAAISMSSLVASGKLAATAAVVPILVGVTANAITKMVVAFDRRSIAFTAQVTAGIVLMVAALWSGTLINGFV
jgi:uncharacterized membrane protein (DUF4010 family)